jgi:uncharacterized repeat protein (TIGR04076 family)
MTEASKVGYRVLGTIKAVKGYCHAGHQTGDEIELDGHRADGLCGFLYHQAFPYIIMLQLAVDSHRSGPPSSPRGEPHLYF